jgi:hypothetical protein
LFASKDRWLLSRALRYIGLIGPNASAAEDALLLLLDEADPYRRDEAIQTLAAIEASSPRAVAVYRSCLREPDRGLRLPAAVQLARLHLDLQDVLDVWRSLAPLSEGDNATLVASLARWPEALQQVLALAGDTRAVVRAAVADVLGHAREPEDDIVVALARLLDDADLQPRLRACIAIGRSQRRADIFVVPLGRCLNELALEQNAIAALRCQGPAAAILTLDLLCSGVERRHTSALVLLRDLGEATQPHAEAFRLVLDVQQPDQARRAGVALCQCARQWPDAVAILSGWLDDPSPAVRDAASAALAALRV